MPKPAPKNLLFLLSDNHARGYLGCYRNPLARTPNLDRLAARGARFTNAYSASPLCCPARAALATGRFPHQTGYWDNAIPFDGHVVSWMRRLRDAGHTVSSIGKLHFRETSVANGFSEELLPMHILDGKGGVHMLLRAVNQGKPQGEPVNAGQWHLYMDRSGVGTAPYQAFDREITTAAIAWLQAHANDDGKPWVLFVSYPSAHPPFSVPAEFYRESDEAAVTLPDDWQTPHAEDHAAVAHLRRIMNSQPMSDADEPALRRVLAGYLALTEHLDTEIGKVLAALEESGLAADTRVVYTSDHGELAGAHGLFGKSCMFEESIGVPLILAGPDVPEGAVINAPVSHVDLYPTILEGAGLDVDENDVEDLAVSLWAELKASETQRTVFAEYHAAGSKSGSFMLREGHWKLLYHVGMQPQLFDLESDPNELRDLGPNHPMAGELDRKLRVICDPEDVDARAKSDQRRWIEHWGGADRITSEALMIYTPPPGQPAEVE
ncbi:MAG: sulfatase-like hydrolase/transferase [Pseudomonadota bacterium]